MIVRINFIHGNGAAETIENVDRWDIRDGELNLYRLRGSTEEIHLGSFPLCNIRKWLRIPR